MTVRGVASDSVTVLAVALVWFGLTAPDRLGAMSPSAFVQIPLELVLLAVLVVVSPPGRPASRQPCWGSCSAC